MIHIDFQEVTKRTERSFKHGFPHSVDCPPYTEHILTVFLDEDKTGHLNERTALSICREKFRREQTAVDGAGKYAILRPCLELPPVECDEKTDLSTLHGNSRIEPVTYNGNSRGFRLVTSTKQKLAEGTAPTNFQTSRFIPLIKAVLETAQELSVPVTLTKAAQNLFVAAGELPPREVPETIASSSASAVQEEVKAVPTRQPLRLVLGTVNFRPRR